MKGKLQIDKAYLDSFLGQELSDKLQGVSKPIKQSQPFNPLLLLCPL